MLGTLSVTGDCRQEPARETRIQISDSEDDFADEEDSADETDSTDETQPADENGFTDDNDSASNSDYADEFADEDEIADEDFDSVQDDGKAARPKFQRPKLTASFLHWGPGDQGDQDDHNKATHHLFGDLYLDEPDEHLSLQRAHEYYEFCRAFRDLENRIRTSQPSPSFDPAAEFRKFQEEETRLWSDRGIERPREELVCVSGNIFTSPLAHRLHNPSFTTLKTYDGTTADSSNACTALVMANGFDKNSVMMDHIARREVKDPYKYYTEDILACHKQYLSAVRDHMIAHVEVVYGSLTWKRNLVYLQGKLQPLDLWGSHEGIRLFIEWDSREKVKMKRFLISAFHPQAIMAAHSRAPVQDRLLEVAYKLAGVSFIPGFFNSAPWQKLVRVPAPRRFTVNRPLVHASKLALYQLHSRLVTASDLNTRTRSDRLLRFLAPELVGDEATFSEPAALRPSASTTPMWPRRQTFAWSHLLEGDTKVGEARCTIRKDTASRWTKTTPPMYVERRWKCHSCNRRSQFLPIDATVRSIGEWKVSRVYQKLNSSSVETQLQYLRDETPSPRFIGWRTFDPKPKSDPKTEGKEEMPRRVQSEFVVSREDTDVVISTKCSLCRVKGPPDYDPQWLKDSDVYLARRTYKCMAPGCVGKSRHWIPLDDAVKYMTQCMFEKERKRGDVLADKIQQLQDGRARKHRDNRNDLGRRQK